MFRPKQQLNSAAKINKIPKNSSEKINSAVNFCILYMQGFSGQHGFKRHVLEYAENEGCIKAERHLIHFDD